MTALELKAINMLGQFPDEKIAHIINYMENLKNDNEGQNKSIIGIGKGKLLFPDDIDFCNDEIAELFYGGEV